MTRVFTADGVSEPVTVIHVIPNRVSQIKTRATDGYDAIQLTGGTKKNSRVNRPMAGHFAKASVEAGDIIREFKVADISTFSMGQLIELSSCFQNNQFVDVSAIHKGNWFYRNGEASQFQNARRLTWQFSFTSCAWFYWSKPNARPCI